LQCGVAAETFFAMDATAGRAVFGRRRIAALLAGVALPALLLCACGSSKPAYCVKSAELKSAVSALTHLDLSKEGIAGAEAALKKVQNSAEGLVKAAKEELPKQTEAISTSAKELADSVKAASTNSSAASAIPAEIVALGSAVNSFVSETKSKCE
jgi:hypothetical protein